MSIIPPYPSTLTDWAIVVSAISTVIFTILVYFQMRQTNKAMAVTGEEIEARLRPFLSIEHLDLFFEEGRLPPYPDHFLVKAIVKIKNYGDSPATNVIIQTFNSPNEMPNPPMGLFKNSECPDLILMPEQCFDMPIYYQMVDIECVTTKKIDLYSSVRLYYVNPRTKASYDITSNYKYNPTDRCFELLTCTADKI